MENLSLDIVLTSSGQARHKRASLPDLTAGRDHPSSEGCHARIGPMPNDQKSKGASQPDLASPVPNRRTQSLREWESSVKGRDRIERERRSQGGLGVIDLEDAGWSMVPTAIGAMTPTARIPGTGVPRS